MKTLKQYIEEAKKGRCWTGYKPVPGKKPYSPGSCEEVKEEFEVCDKCNQDPCQCDDSFGLGEEVEQVDEKAPPGFEGTVKAMKKHKDIDNPSALAWSMKNKGYKSHKKADGTPKNEEVEQIDEIGDPAEMYRKATQTAKAKLQTMKALDRTRDYEKKRLDAAKLKPQNEEVELDETAAWQRKEGKSESGGLNQKGVESYRRENPGSKLKTAVTTKPSKLKPGSKAANRRKSFCARMSGMKKRLTSAATAKDPDSRINKSLRKWNC